MNTKYNAGDALLTRAGGKVVVLKVKTGGMYYCYDFARDLNDYFQEDELVREEGAAEAEAPGEELCFSLAVCKAKDGIVLKRRGSRHVKGPVCFDGGMCLDLVSMMDFCLASVAKRIMDEPGYGVRVLLDNFKHNQDDEK